MYFVGYLIRGEAGLWHTGVVRDVSERFHSRRLYEKVPPHLTLYRPFKTDDIEGVRSILHTFALSLPWGEVHVDGYGRFDDKVVYATALVEEKTKTRVIELQKALYALPGMPENRDPWNPHATIAYRMPGEMIERIWQYVVGIPRPDFKLSFDNLALFRLEGTRWQVEAVFAPAR